MFSHDVDMKKLAEKVANPKICRHDQSRLALAFATLRNGCGYKTSLGLKKTDWANGPNQITDLVDDGLDLAWSPDGFEAFDASHNLISPLMIHVSPLSNLREVAYAVDQVGLKASIDTSKGVVFVSPK
jgi:hypothetical protein